MQGRWKAYRSVSRRRLARRYQIADPTLLERLVRDGYAVVPVLDDDELRQVRAIRERHGSAPGDPSTGLFNDSWSTDLEYKRVVSEELGAVLRGALERHLPDHRPLGFAHIVKWPGPGGSVVAHRDPTFVDERHHRSVMLWCPLTDADDRDGALWVVPASHRKPTGLRVHQHPDNVVEGIEPVAEGPGRLLRLRAGEGILYDHSLVHLSGPNEGPRERVAIASPLIPRDARALYAVVTDDGVQTLEIDESLFTEHRLCDLDIPRVLASFSRVDERPQPVSTA